MSSAAFHHGPTNLQPVNGSLYVARQFGPLNANGDIFEASIRSALSVAGSVKFVDVWNWYHRSKGEVHCASVVKRAVLGIDWWTKIT
jgi:hypothetical protein